MKVLLICGVMAFLVSCSQPPPAKQVPPPPEPPVVSVPLEEKPVVVEKPAVAKPAVTVPEKLDRLQGELEWVKKRLPERTAP